jgi:esterase/lipase superfamily enzyme
MNVEYHKWWSNHLNQDMELKVYGHAGKPVLVFPTQGGRFYEYEDFGMVEVCRGFIDEGKIRLFTVDSIDNQSWANWALHPADRARRHEDYDRYITNEVVPFIQQYTTWKGKYLTTGCSMGAYHAPNFFFRHPDIFDAVIALSGILRLTLFIGDYMDETVYYNTPLVYLRNLTDETYLSQYRQSAIIVCSGQGAWEGPMLADARELKAILDTKQVPCWIDIWGYDVNHDWPWWRRMMPYILGKLEFKKSAIRKCS